MERKDIYMKKIAVITDFDMKGSGYKNLSVPLLQGLAEKGYDIKVAGLAYKGEEHWWDFSIIPAETANDVTAIIKNLEQVWKFDILLVLLDIPMQEGILQQFQSRAFKYIGVFPIEAPPLCMSWAMVVSQMDKALVISDFGAEAVQRQGIDAQHIQIGIDLEAWQIPNKEQRKKLRDAFGIEDDTFVILTVADNQERKNLSRSMEIVADFVYDRFGVNSSIALAEKREPVHDVRYIIVTREHFWGGWKLRDYAVELGINNQLEIIERGISHQELWNLYALADAFLITSKAEGLGMPVLEAMAMKIPIVATNFAGLGEHLQGGKNGFPIDYWWQEMPEDHYRDPFGNGLRVFAKRQSGSEQLWKIKYEKSDKQVENAYKYVTARTHQISVEQLAKAIEGLYD
jgi:glycosyltransferase involved in cell wall biosynthesis